MQARKQLAAKIEIPEEKLRELVILCDFSRITGVGPIFAQIMYDAGIRSAREFLSGSAEEMYERLSRFNDEKQYTKAKFSLKDIEYCMELGRDLPLVLEF